MKKQNTFSVAREVAARLSDKIRRAPDGLPLMVVRPDDPAKALAVAAECARTNDNARLANMLEECGPYKFVGYATHSTGIVDTKGREVDRLAPGDSFITERDVFTGKGGTA
jgi:hypothetical protein